MTKIFTLQTWKIFIFLILPVIFPTSFIGNILTVIWAALFGYSVYMLGNMLYPKLPLGHDLNIKRFNFNLIFAFCYLAVILIFMDGYNINQDNYSHYGWTLAIILPLHFYTMFAIFYCIYFIAKSIATIEFNRVVKFDTYAGNFFLLWFCPVGIWWIHPKVRKIFLGNSEVLPT